MTNPAPQLKELWSLGHRPRHPDAAAVTESSVETAPAAHDNIGSGEPVKATA